MALKLGEGSASYFALHRTREMNYLCVLHLASSLFSSNLKFYHCLCQSTDTDIQSTCDLGHEVVSPASILDYKVN